MSTDKSGLPSPRILSSQEQVAALLGKPKAWFRKNRLELEKCGFPHFDRLLDGWDQAAIHSWIDNRSGIKHPSVGAVSSPDQAPGKAASPVSARPEKPKVYTAKMAAARLGFSIDTIYNMINSKELGCIRRPNCAIRIKEEHILAYEGKFEQQALSVQARKDKGAARADAINRAASIASSIAKARKTYAKPPQPQD